MLRGILTVIFGMLLQSGWTALRAVLPAQPANAEPPAVVAPAIVRDLAPPPPDDPVTSAMPFGLMLGGCGPAFAIDQQALLEAAAGALGLTPDELQSKLSAGQTLGQVVDAQGVDRAAVTAALQAAAVASFKAELDAAVQAGDLTQAEAAARLSDFEAQDFSAWLDRPYFLVMPDIKAFPLPFGDGEVPFGGDLPDSFSAGGVTVGLDGFNYEFKWQLNDGARYSFSFNSGMEAFRQAAASALGLSLDQLAARLDAGETLEDIATAQNVPIEDLRAALHTAMVAAAQADVAQAVAEGKLTQAQADQILDQIAHIDDAPVFAVPGLPFPPSFATPEVQEEDTTTY